MKKTIIKNQSGFAHIYMIVIVIFVVGAISFVAGNVYNTQQKNKELTRQAEATKQAEKEKQLQSKTNSDNTEKDEIIVPDKTPEAKSVEVAKPAPVATPAPVKPKPAPVKESPPSYSVVNIASTSSSVSADNVILKADLPGTYSGTCTALVKLPDGSNASWYEASLNMANSCTVSVPKSKLGASATWKFYMHFKTTDKSIKGESGAEYF